jgi:MarR family transcriptional regulator for hemolysin
LLSAGLSSRQGLQLRVAFTVSQTARRFQRIFVEAASLAGQSDARVSLLYFLENSPTGLTQTELAGRLGISGPSLTRQLDKLEALGFVSRQRMIGDGRARLIMIEPAGRDALIKLDSLASAMRDRIFSDISDADLEAVQRVLDVISARLESDPGLVTHKP